jgi:ATP-dependent DNA helicase RecG
MPGFNDPLHSVVGGATAKALATAFEMRTLGDLLRHYPRRYVQRGELTALDDLRAGEYVTLFAEVVSISSRKLRPKLFKTDVRIQDGRNSLTVTFFNQPWREKQLPLGRKVFFAGKVELFRRSWQMVNPEVQLIDDDAGVPGEEFAGAILPVYPASAKIDTFKIQRSVRIALEMLDTPDDPLPARVRLQMGLVGLRAALDGIHRPKTFAERDAARRRLAFDEAFVMQVALAQRRAGTAALPAVARPAVAGGLLDAFDARLPFELTTGQVAVGEVIAAELAQEHPMHRLLQGEVGSGKTVVAVRAMLRVVDGGGQCALLAPTEVLAQQHFRSITAMLGPLALRDQLGGADQATSVTLLTGSLPQSARKRALLDAASGTAGIVIGTHALLQEHVQFADLGLVVIDEQHRFGVEQRDALRAKARDDQRPHVLVMTATPIPRTVAMTVYGDLEVSTLDELPKGRAPIATYVAPVNEKPAWQQRIWQRIREEVDAGHQAYVVCPRIGDRDDAAGGDPDDVPGLDADPAIAAIAADAADEPDAEPTRPPLAALDVFAQLRDGELNGVRVGLLHGRLPADEKDAVMRAFVAGDIDVLVATTVVEVGVDVANATTMVVLDADRFGISQLHQLRGRVGRGSAASICILVTEADAATPARERLDALAASSDGFALSELDLEQRREGTILGEQQHGRSDLRLLSLLRDRELVEQARELAVEVVAADPRLRRQPALAAEVARLTAADKVDFLEKA